RGDGFDPTSDVPVTATFANATAGVRWLPLRNLGFFGRYVFQLEAREGNRAPDDAPNFVRHFFLAGGRLVWGGGPEVLGKLPATEEYVVMEHAEGLGPTPEGAPVHADEPLREEPDRRGPDRLPGDETEGERRREEQERERWNPQDAVHPEDQDAPFPGE